jgi:hypothetical protein
METCNTMKWCECEIYSLIRCLEHLNGTARGGCCEHLPQAIWSLGAEFNCKIR